MTTPFDYRSRAALPDGVARALAVALEAAAVRVGLLLGSLLRRDVRATIGAPERTARDALVRAGATWFALDPGGVARSERGIAVAPDGDIVRVAELLMGGPGLPDDRPPTDLERRMVASHLSVGVAPIAEALAEHGVEGLVLVPAEPDELVAASELVRFPLTVEAGTVVVEVALHLPAAMFVAHGAQDVVPEPEPELADALGEVPVPVSIRFAPLVLSAEDLDALAVGDVIRLEHPVDEPLVAEVGGRRLFLGRPGRRGRDLAVEVTAIL